MRKVDVLNMRKIKAAVPRIEEKVKIKISMGKSWVVINGPELQEFLVEKIVRAVDFGFDVEDALLLLNEDFTLEFIDIKEHTNRKNMKDIRARLIGTDGKARKTIEKLTGSVIVIKDNDVGVIVDADHLEAVTQGLESLIHGAKHGNVFSYLEKQGSGRLKKYDPNDLGLRDDVDDSEIEEVLDDEEIG
jgi:ribosomal RNA assembly protein